MLGRGTIQPVGDRIVGDKKQCTAMQPNRNSARQGRLGLGRLQHAHRDKRTIAAIIGLLLVRAARHIGRHIHRRHIHRRHVRDGAGRQPLRRHRRDQRRRNKPRDHEDRKQMADEPAKIHAPTSHRTTAMERPATSQIRQPDPCSAARHQLPGQRHVGRQRHRVVGHVAGGRMRGIAGDHHLGLRIDIDALAVNAPCHIGAVRIVAHPPLVPVRGAGQRGVAGGLEFFGIAAARDILDHRRRHDLAAVETAVIAHGLAEAGQIAQRGRQAAAAALGADAVDMIVRIFLRAHRRPDPVGQQLGQRHPADAPADPGERVGVDGLVGEGTAVLALLLLHTDIIEVGGGSVVAGFDRRHAVGAAQAPDIGGLVGVDLGVGKTGGHVHHLLHAGIAERAGPELRHVAGHRRLRIDLALRHQDAGQRAGERLGHRHGDVWLVRLQRAEIALVDQLAPMQHRDAVGVGLREHLRESHGAAVHGGGHRAADVALRARQLRCGPRPAPHVHGRHQLAQVAPGPAQFGKAAERTVLKHHRPVRRRRQALHPSLPFGIGLGGGRKRLAGDDGHDDRLRTGTVRLS